MTVGIIGLGIMGSAYAKNLRAAGIDVIGCDPSADAREKTAETGAFVHEGLGDWLRDCSPIILSLANPAVLRSVVLELGNILSHGQIVVETGTFSLEDKSFVQEHLSKTGVDVLDCPVSGTGAQAATGDLVMMASGPRHAIDQCHPVFAAFTRIVLYSGDYGAGIRLKFVANHAVAVHNCAAAETLSYASTLGLDSQLVYELLSTGAGQSRMSDLRMPLMIEDRYMPPTASLSLFEKDMAVIGENIEAVGATAPLFEVCDTLYKRASAELPSDYDTAAVYEVYRRNLLD